MRDNFLNKIDQILLRHTPDPFVIALMLTFLVFFLSVGFTSHDIFEVSQFWYGSFWSLLAFTLQMAMILLGGFLVAGSRPVQKLLCLAVSAIKTPTQAVIICTLGSAFASMINWGFGLIIAAFLARELAKNVRGSSFRILVASGYSGFIFWHGGLSGSIPLLLNTPESFSEKWTLGIVPLEKTLLSPFNITTILVLLFVITLTNVILNKLIGREDKIISQAQASSLDRIGKGTNHRPHFRFKGGLEHSSILNGALVLMALVALFIQIKSGDFRINLDSMNFILFIVAMILYSSPLQFLSAVGKNTSKLGPILIQFPLYAGIMGMMKLSGLAAIFSEAFVSLSSANTFPIFSFLSAGLVNIFVPSGGGQWAIQAPIILPAAIDLGVDLGLVSMAVAWGDAWTNLAQPFWALPLLAVAGLAIKDIMAFCLVQLFITGLVIGTLLFIFS